MATLESYRNKFAESGWEIFERAVAESRRRGQNYLGVEHVLHALFEARGELFNSLLGSLVDSTDAPAMFFELIEERVRNAPKHEGPSLRLAVEAIDLFKRALSIVRAGVRRRIEATDLFITLLMDEKSLLRELLSELMANPRAEAKNVHDLVALVESIGAGHRPSTRQYLYSVDELVRVKSGPFASFTGKVTEVDEDASKLRVRVFIMGREQPVALRFLDVEKVG